ncbi:MAG: Trk system potassium transporter TrkA [Clostridiaceae bacterium]|jgi:trk system potassium uptake protein TrkA|nr:Trk system potassium transporter TrkA [Clostridiaceae bacterium]
MRIIIIGAGKVGSAVAEMLSNMEHDVVVIDRDSERVQRCVSNFDTSGIVGSGTNYDILKEAGVAKAHLLLAVTGSDESNLLSCLLAKKAGAKETVARIENPEYFERFEIMKADLGLSMTVNPDDMAAGDIARQLRLPYADKVDFCASGRAEIVGFNVAEACPIVGMTMRDVRGKFGDVLVCVIKRGDKIIIPSGNTTIEVGDELHITAKPKNIVNFFKKIKLFTVKPKKVMLLGGGRIAYYLAEELIDMGMKVTIVEEKKARAEELSVMLPEANVILGDGTDQAVLIEEGIDDMDAVITLMDADEENIIISLFAKSREIDKVITKVKKRTLSKFLYDSLKIESIISPHWVAANRIVSYIRGKANTTQDSKIDAIYKMADEKAEALEFRILDEKAEYVDIPLKMLKLRPDVIISGILRGNDLIIPGGDDVIKALDTVLAVTAYNEDNPIIDFHDLLK